MEYKQYLNQKHFSVALNICGPLGNPIYLQTSKRWLSVTPPFLQMEKPFCVLATHIYIQILFHWVVKVASGIPREPGSVARSWGGCSSPRAGAAGRLGSRRPLRGLSHHLPWGHKVLCCIIRREASLTVCPVSIGHQRGRWLPGWFSGLTPAPTPCIPFPCPVHQRPQG